MQSKHIRFLLSLTFLLSALALLSQPTFTVSSIEESQGQAVCLDITVEDFTQIQTLQFSVNWDPTVATFDRVDNFAVASLSTANFNLTLTDDGKIGVSWEDFSFEGTTLNDGQILFSICMQLTGNSGQISAVRITDDPVAIDVTDVNSMGNPIGQTLNDGQISILESSSNALILYYDDIDITSGESFCIPLRARNFQNITALQFSINFNNNRFRFDQITNLENWNGSGFASPSTFNANSKGEIGYAYIDFSFEAMGNDLDDGGVLFEICLTHMLDETCINDELILSSTPTEILATHFPGDEEIDVQFEGGRIKAGSPISLTDSQTTNVTCSEPNSGAVEVTVTGGELGHVFKWSNGGSTNRIENLEAGNYIVTVSDQCLGVDSIVMNYLVQLDGSVPFAEAGESATLTCESPTAILQGSGMGAANLAFSWRGISGQNIVSGATTTNPVIGEDGIYELTVINQDNGCTAVDSTEVFSSIALPTAEAGPDEMLECGLTTIILNAAGSSSGNDISYIWSTMDGNITTNPSSFTIIVDQSGTYKLTVRDDATGCEAIDSLQVSGDNTLPQASISGATTLTCSNSQLVLNANNGGNAPNQAYSWTTTNGNIVSGANDVDVVIDLPGTYQVTVTNTNSSCTDEATIMIMADQDMPTITASEDLVINCNNAMSALSASSQMNVDYNWTVISGDAQIVGGQGTNAVDVMGAGSLVVTATNAINGCFGTDTTIISVNNNLPIAAAGDDFDACNAIVTLSANITNEVNGEWTALQPGPQINDINAPSTEVSGLSEGVNSFVWTLSSNDCGAYSMDTVSINLASTPVAVDDLVEVNQGFGTVNMDLLLNDIYPDGTFPFVTLLTDPEEGNITGHDRGMLAYTISDESIFGTFMFDYEVCDDICSTNCDTATARIIVRQEIIVPIDTTNTTVSKDPVSLGITPNGDGLNEFLVFDELILSPEKYQTKRLIVYNRWGDIVHESRPYQNNWSGTNKKGQPLPQGTYYFVMQLDIGAGAIIEGDVTILK